MFEYFYGSESEQFTFYRIQKYYLKMSNSNKYLVKQNFCMDLCLTE